MPRDNVYDDAVGASAGPTDADKVSYSPTVLADWDGNADPGNVDAALDQLAERVDDNEIALAPVVTAAAVIADHAIVRGDGGARGVQGSGVTIDDNGNVTAPGSTHAIGSAGTDTTLTFTGAASGIIEWDQTNDRFEMADKWRMNDDVKLVFGSSEDAAIQYRSHGTLGSLQLGIILAGAGGCSGYISIMDKNDIGAVNRRPAGNVPDPVLRIYSADEAEVDDYVELYHDQTDGYITNGNGKLVVGKLGDIEIGDGNLRTVKPNTNQKINLGDDAGDLYYLDICGTNLRLLERASDPTEPQEGRAVIWMSDGTGKGDDGDVLIASKAGGITKWTTLFDHNLGAAW